MAETMKAWQFSSAKGGLEKNLHLNSKAPKPSQELPAKSVLIQVISMSVNPADYKVPELGIIGALMSRGTMCPGMDYCGRVAATGASVQRLKEGQLVFGKLDGPSQFGTMAEYTIAPEGGCAPLPDGIDPDQAAAIGVAGQTAYQSIVPNIKQGDKVFINGGSGGTGTFGIQIAKAFGCHVTTTCSTANVELCKSLGADEVLDYKSLDVCEALKDQGQAFDLVVDNVGTPKDLYKASTHFLKPTGKFVQVGMGISMSDAGNLVSKMLRPAFLGGGTRAFQMLVVKTKWEELLKLAELIREEKLRSVIDEVFEFENAPKAYEKLKTGRTKGKIVVHVAAKAT